MGALSLTASKVVQREGFTPFIPGVHHVPFNNPYRCLHGREEAQCRADCICADYLEKVVFKRIIPAHDVAAIIFEPIQGEGGYVVPDVRFVQQLREICDKHGIMLIADEVQSGMGRTGKWWAIEHWGVEPDIVCTAKGIASGIPLGGIIARRSINTWPAGAHGNTYGGNPIAAAAALATIDVLEHGGIENARTQGAYMMDAFREMALRHPTIGDIRGKGLMIGLEMVSDRERRTPAVALRNRVVQIAFEHGLLIMGCGTNTMRIIPPLVVTRAEVDEGLAIFEYALTLAEEEMV